MTPQKVDVTPGKIFRFAGFRGPGGRWKIAPGLYRLVCVATDVHTHQLRVVYVGTEGREAGRHYVCGLEEWGRLFTRHELPAREVVAEKLAGFISQEGKNL